MDSFKWKRNLTVTYGVRYSNDRTPYERNGVQVIPRQSLSQFFAERVGGQALGIAELVVAECHANVRFGRPGKRRPGLVSAGQQ